MDVTLHFNSYTDAIELTKELQYKLDYLMTSYNGDFSFSTDNYDVDLVINNASKEELDNLVNKKKGGAEMDLNEQFDYLVEADLVSRESVDILVGINGLSTDTLDSLVYYLSGYRSFDQWRESENI